MKGLSWAEFRHLGHKKEYRHYQFEFTYLWCYTCNKCIWAPEGKERPTKTDNPKEYTCQLCSKVYIWDGGTNKEPFKCFTCIKRIYRAEQYLESEKYKLDNYRVNKDEVSRL